MLSDFEEQESDGSATKPLLLMLGTFDFVNVCLRLTSTEDLKTLEDLVDKLISFKSQRGQPLRCGDELMIEDLKRMGVNNEDSAWRISDINASYAVLGLGFMSAVHLLYSKAMRHVSGTLCRTSKL